MHVVCADLTQLIRSIRSKWFPLTFVHCWCWVSDLQISTKVCAGMVHPVAFVMFECRFLKYIYNKLELSKCVFFLRGVDSAILGKWNLNHFLRLHTNKCKRLFRSCRNYSSILSLLEGPFVKTGNLHLVQFILGEDLTQSLPNHSPWVDPA